MVTLLAESLEVLPIVEAVESADRPGLYVIDHRRGHILPFLQALGAEGMGRLGAERRRQPSPAIGVVGRRRAWPVVCTGVIGVFGIPW